jgi:tryptophan-rich sensory protein
MTELASRGQLRTEFVRWALVLVPGIVLLGLLSSKLAVSGPANPWYAALNHPSIEPPVVAFAIVWPVLYVLMGLAGALIAAARGARGRGLAMGVFAFQLVLNLAWSPLFFGFHQITPALTLMLVLDVMVLATILLFWRLRPSAAWLMLPYLAWIFFATYLNWEFRTANPDADGQEISGAVTRIEI